MADAGQNPSGANNGAGASDGNAGDDASKTNGTVTSGGTNGASNDSGTGDIVIPKYRFDEVSKARAELELKVSGLQKEVASGAEWKKKYDELFAEHEKTKKGYETEKTEARRQELIKRAIGEQVVDLDVVNKLLEYDKITFDDKGELKGLDEQIKELRKSKPFLFKTPEKKVMNSQGSSGVPEKSFARTLAERKVAQQTASKKIKNFF
jgi:hypothetical protein